MSNASLTGFETGAIGTAADTDVGLDSLARHQVDQWADVCDRFLDWQRRCILETTPPPATLEEHRKALKWLLRGTRLLHCEVADPDFPDRSLARNLAIRLRQLEESWQMIHEPMPGDEADALLSRVFADAR